MSHNQKNSDSSAQYRKTGRSNSFNNNNNNQQQQPRQQFPKGGVGGAGSNSSTQSGPASNRSFNKRYNNSNNAQGGGHAQGGGQVRPRSPNVSSDTNKQTFAAAAAAAPVVPNGAHQQLQNRGVAGAPVTSAPATVKPTSVQDPKAAGPVNKAVPSSAPSAAQPPNVSSSSESKAVVTPTKAPDDASRGFPLQFGSMSPGVMNGVQIPARTSSAPPNLDEQKKAQARHESLRAAPPAPVPSIPKQHLPKKEEKVVDQTNAREPQTQPKPKRESQVVAAPHMAQSQKPTMHSIPTMHMHLPYHHPHHHQLQVPLQFGGPNPQNPSQAMSGTSMPMALPMMANPAAQQPMFVTGPPPHQMQSQGMLHQGHVLNFTSQMAPQLNAQLGNMGLGMGPQFPQQHVGKFNSTRKTVKITDPVTHEELRLDGSSSGQRSHPNVQPHSQPVPSFPNPHMNYYPNFYAPGSSVPLNNAQVPPNSQPPRLYSQVTVKPPVVSHAEKEAIQPKVSIRKADPVKPSKGSPLEVKSVASSNSDLRSAAITSSVESNNDARTEVLGVDSGKDKNTNLNDKNHQEKVEVKSAASTSTRSQLPQDECVEPKPTNNLVSGTAKGSLSKTVHVSADASNLKVDDSASKDSSEDSPSLESTHSNVQTEERKDKGEVEAILSESNSNRHLEDSLKSLSLDSPGILNKSEENSSKEVQPMITSSSLENSVNKDEISRVCADSIKVDDNLGASLKMTEEKNKETPVLPSGSLVQNEETDPFSVPSPLENETGNTLSDGSDVVSCVKDNILPDTVEPKPAMPKGKKKKKDLYKKAEAAGTSSDLYNAYKGPEEKKEAIISTEGSDNASTITVKQPPAVVKPSQNKVEPDDWEDAAEISTPQLETSINGVNVDKNALTTKTYSRDFLLKFAEQCVDLPDGFEITSDIADVLIVGVNAPRDSYPSPGRNNERPNSRSDRRGVGLGEDEKWNKFSGPPMLGRGDMRADFGYAANVIGMRPGQGGNYGVLRNPRAQSPVLSGPMQSFGPGMQRNNSESDRWNRGGNFQKGLMPSPQGPMPVIHRAEKKYEVGKVTDEEQAKQRQLKGILNKLTPQNFEKLFQQVKEVNIDNVVTLSGVISQIFDKALMEPTFCEMYANFCFHLSADLPDLSVDSQKITFKRLLLNKCQEEFERGEREEEEANKAEAEGESNLTAEEREEKRLQTRRRMLGNIRLIGELYKKRMLTERIMHECINKLLGQHENPDEENIEALCKLMSTIGEMIDHPRAKEHMDYYFRVMLQLSNNMKLSSRVRFMLRDSIDLRKNKWQQRRKVEGPKKIDEVHRDAAQERHAQSTRLARGPSFGTNVRRGPPMEFTPRAPNMLTSPISQMSSFRPVSPHMRYNNSQDARMEERHLSVPLTQRPLGEDSITLGPQGGLARGMAFRGQPSGPGVNGFGSMPERAAYGQREDPGQRYGQDRPIYEQFHTHEQYGNRVARNTDQSIDRSLPSPTRGAPPVVTQHASTESVLSEDQLHDKSMATIKEFYSARDEKEVAMCIKDLNKPSFYPSLISLWITDSFERKDMERDLLTKLLINLSNPQGGIIIQDQLIKGFESVLTNLEDAENDAPRASEFLGRIFAKVIMENIISLSEIGRLVYEGGEEQGRLLETGIAAKVLGSILEIIKLEKGDSVLNEIRSSSNLELGKFRPPGSNKPLTIDKFI